MTKGIAYQACQHTCPENCATESIDENDKSLAVNGRKDHPFKTWLSLFKSKAIRSARLYCNLLIHFVL